MNISPRSLLLAALLPLSLSAAVETWTNLDGQKMEAEFIAQKGNYVSFIKSDGARFLYPYEKLSETDRARVDVLTSGKSVAAVADPKSSADPSAAPAAPATATTAFARQLSGKLVTLKGKSLGSAPDALLSGTKVYAIYYSAQWCPPCRAFTPGLIADYKKIKTAHPEFELIFVSSDRDEKSMTNYMVETGMPFPALRFSKDRSNRLLARPEHESGIPNLVFVDGNGKDISASFTSSGDYQGPKKVLADINKYFRM